MGYKRSKYYNIIFKYVFGIFIVYFYLIDYDMSRIINFKNSKC